MYITWLCRRSHLRQTPEGPFYGGNEGRASKSLTEAKKIATLSFNDNMVDAVALEQEDVESTVGVTKRHEPLNLKEKALPPSPLSVMP